MTATHEPLGLVTLRSPYALAPATLLIGAVGIFLAAIEAVVILPGATLGDAVITAAAAALIVSGILAVCGQLLARRQTYRVWSVAASYLVAGVGYVLVIAVVGHALGADQHPEFAARSLVSVILVAGWFTLIAMLLSALSQDRKATDAMVAEQAQLDAQQAHYEVAVAAAGDELRTRIDAVARPAIATAQSQVSQLRTGAIEVGHVGAQLRTQAESIRALAEGDVRSLSHLLDSPVSQLATVSVYPPSKRSPGESTGAWITRAISQSTVVDPIQPIPVTLTIWLVAIPLFVWTVGFRGLALLVAIGAALTLTYLAIARRIVQPRLMTMSPSLRIAALAGVVLGSAAISTLTVYFWYPPEVGELIGLFLRTLVVTSLAIAAWACIAASAEQSKRSRTALAAAVAQRRLQVTSLQIRLDQLQRGAGQLVHGKVQGCLVAAALTLAMLERQVQARTDESATEFRDSQFLSSLDDASVLLRDAQREISSVGSSIDQPSQETAQFFAELTQTWSSVMNATYSVADDAVIYLDGHDRLREFMCETAREAVSNAARHGAATSVFVELTMPPGRLELRCTDNGLGVKRARTGRGLQRLDEAGVGWNLATSESGGARLTVSCPLSTGLP